MYNTNQRQKATLIAVMIFYLLIETISISGNILVIIIVYTSKQLHQSQYVYNCSIAISDIFWVFSISLFYVNKCFNLKNLDSMHIKEQSVHSKPNITVDENNVTIYEYPIQRLTLSYEFDIIEI